MNCISIKNVVVPIKEGHGPECKTEKLQDIKLNFKKKENRNNTTKTGTMMFIIESLQTQRQHVDFTVSGCLVLNKKINLRCQKLLSLNFILNQTISRLSQTVNIQPKSILTSDEIETL